MKDMISAHRDVLCPDREATLHLSEYIEEHSVPAGVFAIKLRLPTKISARLQAPLERRVYATLFALCSASDPDQTYSVDLAQTSGGAAPYFSGALALHTTFANDCVGLVLAGRYRSPPDGAGTHRERTFGRRIAEASASDLLRSIATYLEVASARNEAAQAGKRACCAPVLNQAVSAAPITALPRRV